MVLFYPWQCSSYLFSTGNSVAKKIWMPSAASKGSLLTNIHRRDMVETLIKLFQFASKLSSPLDNTQLQLSCASLLLDKEHLLIKQCFEHMKPRLLSLETLLLDVHCSFSSKSMV